MTQTSEITIEHAREWLHDEGYWHFDATNYRTFILNALKELEELRSVDEVHNVEA